MKIGTVTTSRVGEDRQFADRRIDLWQQLFESSSIGFGILDRELRYVKVNEALAHAHGVPVGAHRGRTVEQIIPEAAGKLRGILEEVLHCGRPVKGVVLRLKKPVREASRAVWSADFSPIYDSGGEVAGVSCVVTHIGGAFRVKKALKEHIVFEKFLAELSARFVNVAPDKLESEITAGLRRLVKFLGVDRSSFWQFGGDGTVIVLGAYAVPGTPVFPLGSMKVFDWYQNEIRSGRTVCFGNPDEVPHECVTEREYIRSVGMKSHVGIAINIGGSHRYGFGVSTFREERTFEGELVSRLRFIGEVFANAVARRNSEQELRQMLSELAHVTRVTTVGQLAASIAHEINQPLSAIVSNAQAAARLLLSDLPDDRLEVQAALREIAQDGKRACEVLSRARNLLRRQDMDFKPLKINELVQDVLSLMHSDSIIRGVLMRQESAAGVPDVMADRVQIQQVLLNLIVNGMDAIAAKPAGPRQITVRAETVGRRVRVSVIDTGIGLKPGISNQMFKPFFTTKQQGLGMGLAINRSIIEAHGGRLWANRNATDGATLAFDLPIAMEQP